jgi:hypothetical protein
MALQITYRDKATSIKRLASSLEIDQCQKEHRAAKESRVVLDVAEKPAVETKGDRRSDESTTYHDDLRYLFSRR